MKVFSLALIRFTVTALAAMALLVAPSVLLTQDTGQPSQVAQPCYNGIVPLDPYANSCTLPSHRPAVRGAAPNAQAIIACRDHPGCLSWYINNPG